MLHARTFSSYTNAWALYVGAKQLGVDLRTSDETPIFPLPRILSSDFDPDWLLFTEESSLRKALRGDVKGRFLPPYFPIELLDDKWAFAEWLKSKKGLLQGLRQWSIDQFDQIEYPCVLKAKHSWQEGVKLPRGWVCRAAADVNRYLIEIKKYPGWQNSFFFQEWLGDKDHRIVSVCGFHDAKNPERNLTAVVERIAAHNVGLSCSAAIQTIEDEWGLLMKTASILDALDYIGPYEVEYLFVNKEIKVLELNPRFWMQHAIFLRHDNGLLKRYFFLENDLDLKKSSIPPTIWVDTVHLVYSLFRLRFNFLRLILKKIRSDNRVLVFWPSLPMAFLVCGRVVLKVIKNKFLKRKAQYVAG